MSERFTDADHERRKTMRAEALRRLLNANGIKTGAELARRLYATPAEVKSKLSSIQSYLRARTPLSMETAWKVAELFNVPPCSLYCGLTTYEERYDLPRLRRQYPNLAEFDDVSSALIHAASSTATEPRFDNIPPLNEEVDEHLATLRQLRGEALDALMRQRGRRNIDLAHAIASHLGAAPRSIANRLSRLRRGKEMLNHDHIVAISEVLGVDPLQLAIELLPHERRLASGHVSLAGAIGAINGAALFTVELRIQELGLRQTVHIGRDGKPLVPAEGLSVEIVEINGTSAIQLVVPLGTELEAQLFRRMVTVRRT